MLIVVYGELLRASLSVVWAENTKLVELEPKVELIKLGRAVTVENEY